MNYSFRTGSSITILSFFVWALLRVAFDGALSYFVTSSTQWIVRSGALCIVFIVCVLLNHSIRISVVSLGAMFVVACGLTFIEPVALSAEAAKLRSAKAVIATHQDTQERIGRKTSEFGMLDWLVIFDSPVERKRYEGRVIDVSGFYLQREMPAIGRLVMTCCGADAQPIFLHFIWTQGLPAENTWIRVKGTVRTDASTGYILAESVEVIPEPKNPYAE